MKQLILFTCIFACSFICTANVQDAKPVSKHGIPILPEKGDCGFGLDANPFFNYLAQIFSVGPGNPFPTFHFVDGQSFYGKYYIEDNIAIRGVVRFGYLKDVNSRFVIKDQNESDPFIKVKDTRTQHYTNFSIGADYLIYRGYGRLRGFYGTGLHCGFGNFNESFEYGNPMNEENPSPTSYNWGNNLPYISNGSARVLEKKEKMGFAISAQALVGAEYFFAPKISIGGEFGFGVFYANYDHRTEKLERWDGGKYEIIENKIMQDKTLLGFDNFATGKIFLMLHF